VYFHHGGGAKESGPNKLAIIIVVIIIVSLVVVLLYSTCRGDGREADFNLFVDSANIASKEDWRQQLSLGVH
jgi:hypothetical protein